MSDENEVSDIEPEDRSIPPVAKVKNTDQRDKYFWPALGVFIAVGLVAVYLYENSIQDARLTDNDGTEFNRTTTPNWDIPRDLPKRKRVERKQAQSTPKQRADDAYWLKRRRAGIVVFDQGAADELPSTDRQQADERQNALFDRLDANLEQARAGSLGAASTLSSSGSGSSGVDLGQRLNVTSTPAVSASLINKAEQPYIIAQGKMLSGTLETAMHSDQPGMVRAVLSQDVYSLDGSLMLLEEGSRLIGEYESGVRRGQSRIFVVWRRVITPNGVDVSLNSPGTDQLGRSGVSGWVDSHFFERFGSSLLLSVVGGLAAREAAEGSDDSRAVRDSIANDFNRSAEIALENSINIEPTIHKNQGDIINIFVARDINFKNAYLMNRRQALIQ